MKRSFVLLLGTAAILLAAGIAAGHNTNSLAPRELAYVPDEHLPVIDGVISPGEYDWVPGKFRVKMADYVANRQATNVGPWLLVSEGAQAYSPADFDVPFAFLGWSESKNAIVIVVKTADDIGYFDLPYEDSSFIDRVRLMVDADHDGGQFDFYDPPKTGMDGQFIHFRPDPGRGGRPESPPWMLVLRPTGYEWAFREPYVQTATVCDEATGSYVVETRMQLWDWLDTGGASASDIHPLAAGETLGMRFAIVDYDSDDLKSIQLSWNSAQSVSAWYIDADDFDDWVLLSPEQTGIATGIGASSWGRIKSSFR